MPRPTTPLVIDASSIVDTVREPLLVLSADLRVRKANRSFFRTFKVSPEETIDQLIYDLGNQQPLDSSRDPLTPALSPRGRGG